MIKGKVKVGLLQGESCDNCGSRDNLLYEFKVRQPEGLSIIWLDKKCLAALTEKLQKLEAKQAAQ